MEPLTAVTATADGTYVFAGGASGSGYVWETASGKLLRIWPAHYKVRHDSRWHVPCKSAAWLSFSHLHPVHGKLVGRLHWKGSRHGSLT